MTQPKPQIPRYLIRSNFKKACYSNANKSTHNSQNRNVNQAKNQHQRFLPPITTKKKNQIEEKYSRHTKFKRDSLAGSLPFEIDHSAHLTKTIRLAWKSPIQTIDLQRYLPIIIDGLSDCSALYVRLADLVIGEIMKHASRDQVYAAIPYIILPLKAVLGCKDKFNCLAGLKCLRIIIKSLHMCGDLLSKRYNELLTPLCSYADRVRNANDDIFYGQYHKEKIGDAVNATLQLLEEYTDDNESKINVYKKLKLAVPTYSSLQSALLVTKSIRSQKWSFAGENQTFDPTNIGMYALKAEQMPDNGKKETSKPTDERLINSKYTTNKYTSHPGLITNNKKMLDCLSKNYGQYRLCEKPSVLKIKPLSQKQPTTARFNIRLVDIKYL